MHLCTNSHALAPGCSSHHNAHVHLHVFRVPIGAEIPGTKRIEIEEDDALVWEGSGRHGVVQTPRRQRDTDGDTTATPRLRPGIGHSSAHETAHATPRTAHTPRPPTRDADRDRNSNRARFLGDRDRDKDTRGGSSKQATPRGRPRPAQVAWVSEEAWDAAQRLGGLQSLSEAIGEDVCASMCAWPDAWREYLRNSDPVRSDVLTGIKARLSPFHRSVPGQRSSCFIFLWHSMGVGPRIFACIYPVHEKEHASCQIAK
jgi:hypothetical protein